MWVFSMISWPVRFRLHKPPNSPFASCNQAPRIMIPAKQQSITASSAVPDEWKRVFNKTPPPSYSAVTASPSTQPLARTSSSEQAAVKVDVSYLITSSSRVPVSTYSARERVAPAAAPSQATRSCDSAKTSAIKLDLSRRDELEDESKPRCALALPLLELYYQKT